MSNFILFGSFASLGYDVFAMIKIYTIGFSGKRPDDMLAVLDAVGVRMLIDVRHWRASKWVPWASGDNLSAMLGARYKYMPELTPDANMVLNFKGGRVDWLVAERIFMDLISSRHPERLFTPETLDRVCFMCTERTAHQCHRRLVAEYLAAHFPDVTITHL